MSTYDVTVIGHDRPVRVEISGPIDFGQPLSETEARLVIARAVGEAVLPDVHDVPPGKELGRDASGQIVRSFDRGAVSREVVAAQIGWAVAGAILGGAEDE